MHLADVLAALGVRSSGVRVGRETSPYDPTTHDGRDRSFFVDVRAAAMGDPEARARQAKFQGQLGEYIAAAMDTADTADAIPPAWGGRWYVEQIEQMRPAVSSFDSTVITDPRSIPIPRFAGTTPAQIVTEHTEGQPPARGVVDVEQIEMKPKGYSGETQITRELLDSSPALVDRMVSEALMESYAQQTEMAFVALIEAGATAGPAGGASALTLELAIRTALARFPTTRFRAGGRILPSAAHYSALSTANAPDGRPLMPYVGYGPTNASGVLGTAMARMEIAGVEAAASWANLATRTYLRAAAADAMSFESSLLDFRFYEKDGPHLIDYAVGATSGAWCASLGASWPSRRPRPAGSTPRTSRWPPGAGPGPPGSGDHRAGHGRRGAGPAGRRPSATEEELQAALDVAVAHVTPLLDVDYRDPVSWPDDLHDGVLLAAVLTYRNAESPTAAPEEDTGQSRRPPSPLRLGRPGPTALGPVPGPRRVGGLRCALSDRSARRAGPGPGRVQPDPGRLPGVGQGLPGPGAHAGPGVARRPGDPLGLGPGRGPGLTATLLVRAAGPDVGLRELEAVAETVLDRAPASWRFARAERPYRAQAGELVALACDLVFSLTASIT